MFVAALGNHDHPAEPIKPERPQPHGPASGGMGAPVWTTQFIGWYTEPANGALAHAMFQRVPSGLVVGSTAS